MVVLRCPSRRCRATVVVVFYTKPDVSPNRPLRRGSPSTSPFRTADLRCGFSTPGRSCSTHRSPVATSGSGRTASSAISIAPITATIEEISVDIELTGDVPRLACKIRPSLFWRRGPRKTLRLASRVPWTGERPLRHRQRGIPRRRQRISRSQLGRRPHGDAHARLVLGARQRRSLYDHRVLHHGDARLRI